MKSAHAIFACALFALSALAAWEAAIHFSHLPAVVLPPPSSVARVLLARRSELAYHAAVTAGEALAGYALANAVAAVLAVAFLWSPPVEAVIGPWTVLIKNVPFVSVASILLIVLGDNLAPKLLIVVLVCFFPLLTNLVQGLRAADPLLLDRMKVINASRSQIFRKVQWPAALPYYLAAHETAFSGSIVAAIVAEWFFARRGLGYLIVQATVDYRGDLLYAVNAIAAAMALAAYWSCKIAERRLLRWQRAQS